MTASATQKIAATEVQAHEVSIQVINEKANLTNGVLSDDLQSEVDGEWTYPWPTDFKLSEHYIDDVPALKVCVIGAGLAGITAGALLPAKVPGAS